MCIMLEDIETELVFMDTSDTDLVRFSFGQPWLVGFFVEGDKLCFS